MRTIQATFCTFIALAFCGASVAQTSRVSLHIEPQPVRLALKDLGEQTGLQIMFRAEDVAKDEMTAPRILGELSATEALDRMLTNTGLQYRFVNPNTVLISAKDGAGVEKTALVVGDEGVRVAQVDSTSGSSAGEGSEGKQNTSGSSEESQGVKLEEVVVTAQKRKENLQDVPISMSVLGGKDLDRSTGQGIVDALRAVPGVAVERGSSSAEIRVRGVGSGGLFAGAPAVGYYLDGAPFALVRSAPLPDPGAFDLERVEVLRGPQGTLYGASALNGVVRVLTKNADPSRFEAKGRALVSHTEDGGENFRGDAVLNVPLVEDQLAVRGVVSYQNLGGWIDSPIANDVNDAKLRDYRFKLAARPTDALSIDLSIWHTDQHLGAPDSSLRDRAITSVENTPVDTKFTVWSGNVNYDFGPVSLSSTTSYLTYSNSSYIDFNPIFALPFSLSGVLDSKVFTQELVLNSETKGPLTWQIGGYYRDAEDSTLQALRFSPYAENADLNREDFSDISQSYAVFGQAGYKFFDDRFEATVGLRYFHDKVRTQENTPSLGFPPVPPDAITEGTFESTTPRFSLSWFPDEDLTFYGSYSQGFRSGFPQNILVLGVAPDAPPLRSDKLTNYEVGAKGNLFGDVLSFDASLYYIDWQDIQQSLLISTEDTAVTAVVNAGSASGPGVDLGLSARLVEGLRIGASVGWNDLAFDSDVFNFGSPVPIFRAGDRTVASPEWTIGGNLNYDFPLSGNLVGSFGLSGNYISKRSGALQLGSDVSTAYSDSLFTLQTALAIETGSGVRISLFADNLTDERETSTAVFLAPEGTVRLRPRTIGLSLEFRM